MNAEFKKNMVVIEQAVHDRLSPLGFKKQKGNWRRTTPELLQQFSVVSMQLISEYRPEWGLNLLSRSEAPTPVSWKLHVRWTFEEMVKNIKKRLVYFDAFDVGATFTDQERTNLIAEFLTGYVLPCFEMFRTEKAVRKMMGSYSHLLRAQIFFNLPESWWPAD